MIRRLQVAILRCRAWWLQAQVEHIEDQLISYRFRLNECYDRLRKIKGQEAMLTPASSLLIQAMRRKS